MSALGAEADVNHQPSVCPVLAEGVEELRRSQEFETTIQNTASLNYDVRKGGLLDRMLRDPLWPEFLNSLSQERKFLLDGKESKRRRELHLR